MKKRIVWAIVGLVIGAMAIAGGLLKAGSTTPNSAVECGGKIMSPGDTCETTSKTGVKKVKTYEEQRQSNQGENYLVAGFGGLIVLISAWQLVKGLRARKTAASTTGAPPQTWNPPAQQWPTHSAPPQHQPQHQWPPHQPTPQHPAPQPAPQQQRPAQPPPQDWLQQTATTHLQPPPQQWDPSQSFGPTGEIPQDPPKH